MVFGQNEYSSRTVMCRMNSVLGAHAPSFASSPAPRRAGEEMWKVDLHALPVPLRGRILSRRLCGYSRTKTCRRRSTGSHRPPALISIGGLAGESPLT